MPETPMIGPDSTIVAFGSCFAANIGWYLSSLGFDVSTRREGKAYVQKITDGLVNVFAIAQQFEWAWENRVPQVELWHGWKAEEYGYDEDVRLATKALFDEADVFILTFGLSEIWYDEPTGEVFWRAVPQDRFDPTRHKFRLATYQETFDQLSRIYELIRRHRPNAEIVFTLSPIPLAATFRSVSAISANAQSKAVLKVAIDQLHRDKSVQDTRFHYFPSYEVVLQGFRDPFTPDLRHPWVHVLRCNMKAFERYFCRTGMDDAALTQEIASALALDEQLTSDKKEDVAVTLSNAQTEWRSGLTAPSVINEEREKRRQQRLADREARVQERDKRREARLASRSAGK